MSRTRARLERIEAALRPAAVMSLFINLDGRDPVGWSHGELEWRKSPDETDEQFKHRMTADVQASMPLTTRGGGRQFLWFAPIFGPTGDEAHVVQPSADDETC